jgi:hypothetical protein
MVMLAVTFVPPLGIEHDRNRAPDELGCGRPAAKVNFRTVGFVLRGNAHRFAVGQQPVVDQGFQRRVVFLAGGFAHADRL